jgi:hypothetical protein
MSERLNNQWRAFGTTIRYALAGGAIFGLTRLVGQLKDVNTQLGLMSAIGSSPSGAPFSSKQVTALGNDLQTTAIKAITPLAQVNDAAVNFLSTVQNVKPSEIPSILTSIGQAATLAQTPIEDLTQAATTMNIAFGRSNNAANISQFSRMWFALISTAPGGIAAAPQIAQAMPALASMFQLAPGHVPGKTGQAQMMSLVLGALRTGMPPSTAMRGVTYLLQSLAQPTGGARTALAGIGITPQFVQQRGIYAAVMRLLGTITKTGNAKQLAQIPEDALSEMETNGANLPGIPASEMIRLRQMVPRIHGIRAAIILASQLKAHGAVTSLQQDLDDMTAAEDNHAKAAQDMSKAWQRFEKRARLQQASVAINAMGLQVASMFNPVLNFAAGHIVGATQSMQRHRSLTRHIAEGGAGLLAALGIARFVGAGRFPIFSRIPGLSGLMGGNAFVRGRAIESALSGATGIGASPQNPLYVIVVGQLFGGNTPGPSNTVNDAAKGAGMWQLMKSVGSRTMGAGKFAIGEAGALSMAGAALFGAGWAFAQRGETGQVRWSPTGRPYYKLGSSIHAFSSSEEHQLELLRAQKLYGHGVTGIEQYRVGMLRGQAEIFLTLDQKDANGKITRRRVHVPLDLWQGGRHPSNRGNAGKTTRGH